MLDEVADDNIDGGEGGDEDSGDGGEEVDEGEGPNLLTPAQLLGNVVPQLERPQ